MDAVDWNEAPEWADRLMKSSSGMRFWCDVEKYLCISNIHNDGTPIIFGAYKSHYTIGELELIEMRQDAWKEGERRMGNIAQNGNNGHYEELENYSKQPRYTDNSGTDWIDEFAANNSIEEFRAAMRFTIGKYERRLGKKDDRSKELYKIADYYKRWSDVEKLIELEK